MVWYPPCHFLIWLAVLAYGLVLYFSEGFSLYLYIAFVYRDIHKHSNMNWCQSIPSHWLAYRNLFMLASRIKLYEVDKSNVMITISTMSFCVMHILFFNKCFYFICAYTFYIYIWFYMLMVQSSYCNFYFKYLVWNDELYKYIFIYYFVISEKLPMVTYFKDVLLHLHESNFRRSCHELNP